MFVSIIITNYNYAEYVSQAIDSALQQTYGNIEVIVVDDGSNDGSRLIIESYGTRIKTVFKINGGQGSAINAGFSRSAGELIFFLDADDFLFPECAQTVVDAWEAGHAKFHFNLQLVDGNVGRAPRLAIREPLPFGDVKEDLLVQGSYLTPPCSGNAYSRAALEQILPMPDEAWKRAGDLYCCNLAALFGSVGANDSPLGCYRVHAGSMSSALAGGSVNWKLIADNLEREKRTEAVIVEFAVRLGLEYEPNALTLDFVHLQQAFLLAKHGIGWSGSDASVMHRFMQAVKALRKVDWLPSGKKFVIFMWMAAVFGLPRPLSAILVKAGVVRGAVVGLPKYLA